ncbi:MAG: thiamine diphosphokinase [Desulforhopalus sp.]
MTALIFANGIMAPGTDLTTLLQQADLVIAADGGANHCSGLGITPDILIGDLDSICPAILKAFEQKEVEIHRHPKRKNATDLELALDLAAQKGAHTIWLIGALGGRWDMSLANIMLAAGDKYKDTRIFLRERDCFIRILHPGTVYTINGMPGQKVSFLPLKGDVRGVDLDGFEYPLVRHTVPFGSTLGVSNIQKEKEASVHHTEGTLLCIVFDKKSHSPH